MENALATTCAIRHFRLGIVIIYKLIIKFVPLSNGSEAEASYSAIRCNEIPIVSPADEQWEVIEWLS